MSYKAIIFYIYVSRQFNFQNHMREVGKNKKLQNNKKRLIGGVKYWGVIDWRIWIECEQAVWSEQRWPNRTKQGCSTQNVRISYKDSVKVVQKRQSPFPLQPLPVWGPVWSDSTPSTPTPDSTIRTITLTLSTLARDSPNRSCP